MPSSKELIEHVIHELFGKGDFSAYQEIVAENIQIHFPSSWEGICPPSVVGRESAKEIDFRYTKSFRIHSTHIDDLILTEDKAAARWSFTATHIGDFFSLKVSNNRIHLTGQTIYSFNKEGKINKSWQCWDMLSLSRQISSKTNTLPFLSPREKECLHYLLEGKTAKETAIKMHLSFRTIEYYFENIKNKLGCLHKRELLAYAKNLELSLF